MTGTGGPDVGAFSLPFTVPSSVKGFTWATSDGKSTATRSQGLTITWPNGGALSPIAFIRIYGTSVIPSGNATEGAAFYCSAPAAPGQFTIPASVLQALPPTPASLTNQSALYVGLVVSPQTFAAPGLDIGVIQAFTITGTQFNYQ